jgi:RimJ/RimL family protein N-acetyltransferase
MLLGKVLKNDSVFLRDLLVEDVNIEYINWLNNPSVNKYLEVRHSIPSLIEQINYINECISSHNKIILGIFTLENDFIGTLKLTYIDSINLEIGIMVGNQRMQGKGFGKSSINLIKKWAKSSGILFLHAGYLEENIRSMKLFKSSGFIEVSPRLEEIVSTVNSKVCRVKFDLSNLC